MPLLSRSTSPQQHFLMNTRFVKNEVITLQYSRYSAGGVALRAFTLHGEPLMTISVWVDHARPDDEIVVKTWGENEGVLEWLVAAGIATDTGERVACGYTEGAVVKLVNPPKV